MTEQRTQSLALTVICAATLMTIVDETVVTVAVPSIQADLGFPAGRLAWVVNAYLIGFGGVLLLAGRLGDLLGRSRLLLAGMTVFTTASVVCGLAVDPVMLVAARFVQGVGGAMATAVALGMIAALFPDERERGRATGTYAFMGAVGASTGLVLGGLVTAVLDWRWAFLVNVPIGVAVVLTGRRVLPREAAPGLPQGQGWRVVLTAFSALGLLRIRFLAAANLAHALFVGAMFTFQFLVTLYLQRVLGYGPARAGLAIVPIAAGIALFSMLAYPRLSARYGARPPLLAGLAVVATGLALLTRVPATGGSYVTDLLPSVVLFAVGGGLTLPSLMTTAMAAAPPAAVGAASGLLNTSQQVGGAVGLAALSAVAAHSGYAAAWGGAALLVVASLLVAALLLRPRT